MSSTRLTPAERLARGLKYSTVGPVDVTRGAVGIGFDSARSSAAWVGNRCLQGARKPERRPRPLLVIGATVAVLAIGAVTFSIVRRSRQPEPSPLPPSVHVAPQP